MNNSLMPQVDKEHYAFYKYGFEGRFVSYYWQLHEVLERHPESILEVGVGDRVFSNFIRSNTKIPYTSIDIASDLSPDVLGSITKLPFPKHTYDLICAFEVLEHLPFEEFDQAMTELSRVARRYIVVSIPHFGPMISFSLKIPFLPHIRFAYKIPFPQEHFFNGQHYWEIGKKGYPLSRIRQKLSQYGAIVSDFVPFGSDYHHFFVLELPKKN